MGFIFITNMRAGLVLSVLFSVVLFSCVVYSQDVPESSYWELIYFNFDYDYLDVFDYWTSFSTYTWYQPPQNETYSDPRYWTTYWTNSIIDFDSTTSSANTLFVPVVGGLISLLFVC